MARRVAISASSLTTCIFRWQFGQSATVFSTVSEPTRQHGASPGTHHRLPGSRNQTIWCSVNRLLRPTSRSGLGSKPFRYSEKGGRRLEKNRIQKPESEESPTRLRLARCAVSGSIAAQIMVNMAPARRFQVATYCDPTARWRAVARGWQSCLSMKKLRRVVVRFSSSWVRQ